MKCEVCGTTEDLRCAPLMTGDSFDRPPEHPVCGGCVRAWYDSGQTTPEGILLARAGIEVWRRERGLPTKYPLPAHFVTP